MIIKFENELFGIISQADWLNVGFNVTRQTDPIDSLFGDEKTDNLTARWQTIAAEYQMPSIAYFHGFDTEANTTVRIPIDTHTIEKGLIKVKINQSERMRELLRSGVQNSQLVNYVLDDGIRLSEEVFTRTKVAKNELLATGKVTIKENNLDLTVDYGVPAAQTAFELDLSTDADVSGQIQDIIDYATDHGVTINGMVTSKKNISKMRRNAGLQKNINANLGIGALIRSDALNTYLSEEFGINRVIVNDVKYNAGHGLGTDGRPIVVPTRQFPENKVTFFATNPAGRLGTGLWGDPPEALGYAATAIAAGAATPYVYIDQWREKDPAVTWTKASALFMPVLYNPFSLFISTVTPEV